MIQVMRKREALILALVGGLLVVGGPVRAQTSDRDRGRALVERVDRAGRGFGSFEATLELAITNASGRDRLRVLRVLGLESQEGDHSLLVLQRPADLVGTSFLSLVRPDGTRAQWMYLPSSGRARRIGLGQSDDAFLGSHFTYADMAPPAPEGFDYRWIRDQDVDGRPGALVERCHRDCATGADRAVLWIETDRWLLRRVDYFDGTGARTRTLTIDTYTEIDGAWRPVSMRMEDLRNGGVSELRWADWKLGVGLRLHDFDPRRLGRGG